MVCSGFKAGMDRAPAYGMLMLACRVVLYLLPCVPYCIDVVPWCACGLRGAHVLHVTCYDIPPPPCMGRVRQTPRLMAVAAPVD